MIRPKLTDKEEMDIIREMYFDDHNPFNSDIDPQEALERQEAKSRNKQQSSQ
jgi:hypothetical protein